MRSQRDSSASAELYQRALKILPGGVSRNTVLRAPHPVYAQTGRGCQVTDVEGVTRIDFSNNMASLIHGHAQPAVVAAVTEQLQRGSAFALATEVEIRYAEHLISRNPGFENAEDPQAAGQQGYFYYLYTVARALAAYEKASGKALVVRDADGRKHNWRARPSRSL